jgi:hypothetical protein
MGHELDDENIGGLYLTIACPIFALNPSLSKSKSSKCEKGLTLWVERDPDNIVKWQTTLDEAYADIRGRMRQHIFAAHYLNDEDALVHYSSIAIVTEHGATTRKNSPAVRSRSRSCCNRRTPVTGSRSSSSSVQDNQTTRFETLRSVDDVIHIRALSTRILRELSNAIDAELLAR